MKHIIKGTKSIVFDTYESQISRTIITLNGEFPKETIVTIILEAIKAGWYDITYS
jgi:hypothetical protein